MRAVPGLGSSRGSVRRTSSPTLEKRIDIAIHAAEILDLFFSGSGDVEMFPASTQNLSPAFSVPLLIRIEPLAGDTFGRTDYQAVERREISAEAIVAQHPGIIANLPVAESECVLQLGIRNAALLFCHLDHIPDEAFEFIRTEIVIALVHHFPST
jgi:hypothetical protein